jgi:hypothetical protein
VEGDRDRVGGAVAVLGDDEVGLALTGVVLLVGGLAVQQDDHVGVLLERTGLSQVADRRLLVGTLLGATVQLRQREHVHQHEHQHMHRRRHSSQPARAPRHLSTTTLTAPPDPNSLG